MYTGKMENYRFEWWHHSISSIELNAGGGGGVGGGSYRLQIKKGTTGKP